MMNEIAICVTAVGSGSFGEQILKSINHAQYPYRIYGTDARKICAGRPLCHTFVSMPMANDPDYIQRMLEFCRKKSIRALLVGSEPELKVLSKNRHLFAVEDIFLPLCSDELLHTCMDKQKLCDVLQSKNITLPWSILITSEDDIQKIIQYPVILKPSQGGGGSADVYIAQNTAEAELFCAYMLKNRGPFLVQEYVGTAEDEYTVGVLTDMHGEHIQSIALKRNLNSALSRRLSVINRTNRQDLGRYLTISSGFSQGQTGQWSEICAPCEDIARILGAQGPFNLQGRMVDDKFMLFEINPRFSGTSHMRTLAGMNEADLLIRYHVLGERIPRNKKLESKTILRRLEEVVI